MPNYPISIPVPAKLTKLYTYRYANEKTQRVQDYVNHAAGNRDTTVINYGDIANELGIPDDEIRQMLQPIGGGAHGITIKNP